ncbi:hypothetical protein H8356DRAFT_1353670, partial [Neocallimastix lanati (nom. inval.)]
VSSSRYDLEGNSRIVERKLKQNMDKELSFNYLDENENLFNSFLVNKETLLKEYIDVRKRIDKYILNNDQTINTIHNNNNNNNNNNTDNTNNNHSNNISNSNNNNNNNTSSNLENNINENLEELTKNNTNTNNNNNSNNLNISNDMNLNKYEIMDSQNMETKNTLASLDKLMEKIIENEKVNEKYKERMDDLIELKNKLIGRQRIRNNRLEFALKEALFFLEKPFDVDLAQTQFLTTLLANFKDNPELLINPNSTSTATSSSTSNSNSMTAQAKKYLKKINKKHDSSKSQNQGQLLKISKEENDLCLQFSITYLKQALDWIEKDMDVEDDYDKFKIKRYLSINKIPKSEDNPISEPIIDNNDI